jgi:hypothetical protein
VNVPLLAPPSDVVNVLAPLALALIDAVTVWFTVEPVPLESLTKKPSMTAVSIVVVEVYLLAVVDSNDVPAASVLAELVLSVKPAHKCGLVPCAESDNVKVLELRPDGALGVDFITNVMVSSSSWKNVSGVPDALNLKLMLPTDVPE